MSVEWLGAEETAPEDMFWGRKSTKAGIGSTMVVWEMLVLVLENRRRVQSSCDGAGWGLWGEDAVVRSQWL